MVGQPSWHRAEGGVLLTLHPTTQVCIYSQGKAVWSCFSGVAQSLDPSGGACIQCKLPLQNAQGTGFWPLVTSEAPSEGIDSIEQLPEANSGLLVGNMGHHNVTMTGLMQLLVQKASRDYVYRTVRYETEHVRVAR
jgi:hypothetical protein